MGNKELTSKKTTLQLRMHNVRLRVQAADSQAAKQADTLTVQ